ncbi:hypothetical protein O6H91_13G001900 [Diphasiastrum complanatum]|uniref:Uncharacterized protein n=3 Tax=Diphasiastrum complanatum TaxID=34168 RepID=A0ACC2BRI2_DIPCM|nr:hypothetical protein O6H91_13G001900 [Diphasiastrum complanatum]KAJ7532391.1 hypothetical protein O6H91_13G001900 [Diphasiastrum complanatum]KAJ7532392.1 hypothetical protein O6H91_13G001900 [Diphasiastrum complanatum]
MKTKGIVQGLWLTSLLLLWVTAKAQTDPNDLAVLQSFIKGLSNPQVLGWNGNDPCGSGWPHVQCKGTSVTAISLAGAGLIGTLTGDLNKLSKLQYLSLQKNSFHGALPSLSGLQNLQTVYLDNNNFDTIPADFFHGLPNLQAIYLDYNGLNSSTGWSLPLDVTGCIGLLNLSLTNTSLSGRIPDFLGTMPSLRVLNLAYNKLSGGIPASFVGSNLVQLQANNMLGPVLTGPIDAVGGMPSLVQLWLQVNQITGTIPAGLSNALTLNNLKLNDNQITGFIPENFTALPLSVFTVDNNLLVGPVPAFQSGVKFLFYGNGFCQSTPGVSCAPEVTALLTFMEALGFPTTIVSTWNGNNPCSGWIGIACDLTGHVYSIALPGNHLVGALSPALGDLPSLVYLKLNGNNITGTIPSSLTKLKSLKLVDLSNNDLSGPPPTFPAQVTVNLQGNSQISKTSVPSSSPAQPVSASPTRSSTPSTPSIIHPTPPSGSVVPPASVALPSGKAPSPAPSSSNSSLGPQISGVGNVTTSDSNHKSSAISISVVVGAVIGAIAFVLLVSLLAYFFYRGHRHKRFIHLQGPNTVMVHPQDSGSERDMLKIVVAGNGSVTEPQSRSSSGPSDMQIVETGNLVISIQVLKHATKNFSEHSILGRGGFGVVYKGELDDGTIIAVKRMEAAVVSSKGLNEFQAEIAVLTKVRHRHLVGLLGYCIDGYEKLLVYEYLSNGTLGQHLFEYIKFDWKPLNWKTRLSIALDVARGMEYLHGLAHKSFIHRDLKPSNILLDDDFRAKVSDFGLVKLAPEGKYSVETKLAGTFGYLAPEYAVTGRVTTKADVFSFGVVLMELISGRRALDETQSEENLHLVAWFRRMQASKESFMKVIDPAIEVDGDGFQSICTVAELAGHCTAREPYQRPDMGHAVNVLAPLVEQWKPREVDWDDSTGIDLNLTLPQALKKWQDFEDMSVSCLDDSQASLPTRPAGFADSFTSADGR